MRSIRVADDVWEAAKANAEADGETISDLVNRLLASDNKARVRARRRNAS